MSVLAKNRQRTCIFHTKLHPGYEGDIFHILTGEDIADVIPVFVIFFFFFFFGKINKLYKKQN